MRKKIFGRKFKKNTNQRKALFRSLMQSMIIHGRIKTTEAKAKAVKGELEKLVTKAAKENSRNHLLSRVVHEGLVDKLINEIGPRYADRPGGYTRIVRLGGRLKDNAEMVLLEWVDGVEVAAPSTVSKKEIKKEKKEKKSEKAEQKEYNVARKATVRAAGSKQVRTRQKKAV